MAPPNPILTGTLTALAVPTSRADAYGLEADAIGDGAHLPMYLQRLRWIDDLRTIDPAWDVVEVTFEDTDVVRSERIPGHPGVRSLWLSAFTPGSTVDAGWPPDGLWGIDPFAYTVTT